MVSSTGMRSVQNQIQHKKLGYDSENPVQGPKWRFSLWLGIIRDLVKTAWAWPPGFLEKM